MLTSRIQGFRSLSSITSNPNSSWQDHLRRGAKVIRTVESKGAQSVLFVCKTQSYMCIYMYVCLYVHTYIRMCIRTTCCTLGRGAQMAEHCTLVYLHTNVCTHTVHTNVDVHVQYLRRIKHTREHWCVNMRSWVAGALCMCVCNVCTYVAST